MQSLNRVTLVGRLGKDPEIRTLEGGVKVGKFTLATSDRYRDKDGNWKDSPTEWHEVVLWRNLAERAEKELTKGKLVYLEGKIQYRTWQDKDGNNRRSTDILARQFRAFERTESSGGGSGGNFPSMQDAPPVATSTNSTSNSNPAPTPVVSKADAQDDDLPF